MVVAKRDLSTPIRGRLALRDAEEAHVHVFILATFDEVGEPFDRVPDIHEA